MHKHLISAAAISLFFAGSVTSSFATGAIAVNDEQGMSAADAGYAVGYGSTKAEASRNAIKECKSAGNDDCKVALTFEQCGAYAGDKVNYSTGVGSTEKAARSAALAECKNCKIVVADCQ